MKIILRIFVLALCLGVIPAFGEEPDDLTRALGKAIIDEDLAAATALLEAGANPNGVYEDWYGTTFLIRAIDRRKNQIAELLLDYGADPDVRNDYDRSAVYYGNSEGIALLISRGARFDIIDNEKESPLMNRIGKDRESQAASLILQWEETNTPRFTAGYITRRDYLSALLPPFFRRSFEYRDNDVDLKLVERLLALGANPAVWDNYAIHGLHHIDSSYHYRQEMLTLFFDRGAPLNSVNYQGKTLLMRAAERTSDNGVAEVEFLLARGANPNFQNKERETALMHAKTIAAANLLLACGAQLDVQDNDGKTALMRTWLYPEVQKTLLDAGADPSIRDNRGSNVLFTVLSSDRREWALSIELIDGFLAGGCDINAYNDRRRTPVMSAANRYDSPVVMALLERGANPLLLDDDDKTTLQIYLESRRSESREARTSLEITVITALLEAGVQPAALDTRGNSALLYVMRNKYSESDMKPIRNLLLKYSSDEEKKTARARVAAEKREDFFDTLSGEGAAIAWGIGLPLVVGGLSIFTRERLFAGNRSANFMGPVNGMLTLGTAGFFLGAMIGASTFKGSGAWADMYGGIVEGFIGGTIGLASGILLACLPPVRRAFNNYPVLYYTPTALSVFGGTIIILNIWF